MTYEEALKVIDQNLQVAAHDVEGLEPEYEQEQLNALKLAKEAVEKQIPKKPHKNHYPKIVKTGRCPRCLLTEDDNANYCRACGQALDWSE